ncbi:MAG TPA: porin [Rhizomicrobium sp.]|nr:porin [Rhizomicrobium sp.]
MEKRAIAALAVGAVALWLARPAAAAGPLDWNLSPFQFNVGDYAGQLGAELSGAAYAARQSGAVSATGVTGAVWLEPSLETVLDNAWELGAKATLLVDHDALSGDNYGNDVLEKGYVFLQTLYGRVELGQQDGAAYKFVLNGPDIDDIAAINDANLVFFKDPATGKALNGVFNLRTGVFDSANDAKISYYIPHFFDFQIGVSYTPYMAKGVLPGIDQGHSGANVPRNILEFGANYAGYFGPYIVRAYGGLAIAGNSAPTPGHGDLRDYGLSAEIDRPFEGGQLSVGGGWRRSNAYTFDVTQPFSHGATRDWRAGATYTRRAWSFALEYDDGHADAHPGLPALHESGEEAAAGYQVNENLALTLGWQHMRFERSSGTFYTGTPRATGDAGFLHAYVHI